MGITRNWNALGALYALGEESRKRQQEEERERTRRLADLLASAIVGPPITTASAQSSALYGGPRNHLRERPKGPPKPLRRSLVRPPVGGSLAPRPINFYRKLQTDAVARRNWIIRVTKPWPQNPEYRWDGAYYYLIDAHGDPDSPYGWDIDHIIPVERGGSDEWWNLRPLLCSVNRGHRGR